MPDTNAATRQPTSLPAERLLQQLEWRVIKRLDGLLQGDYRTLLRGTGIGLSIEPPLPKAAANTATWPWPVERGSR